MSTKKSALKTIRFSPGEMSEILRYLNQNRSFESLSSLGRVAIMEFIRTRSQMPLHPLETKAPSGRPEFLWDYDLTESQVREILAHAPMGERAWLIARILERSSLQEALRYLTAEEIRQALPHVRMDPKVKSHWQEAVELWQTEPKKS